jgi:hypothetical protein
MCASVEGRKRRFEHAIGTVSRNMFKRSPKPLLAAFPEMAASTLASLLRRPYHLINLPRGLSIPCDTSPAHESGYVYTSRKSSYHSIMVSSTRNPLQLLLIPVLLIVILFFTFTANKGTYPPPVKQHDELSIPSDAEDWEFDGALKKIQQDLAGLGQVGVDVEQQQKAGRKSRKVQLDLTVMSRCPDAVSRSTKVTVLNR